MSNFWVIMDITIVTNPTANNRKVKALGGSSYVGF